MSDLWGVLLGGGLTLAGTIGTKIWDGWREAHALRGALRAEISGILEIANSRDHVAKAQGVLRQLEAGHDIPIEMFGTDRIEIRSIFQDNAGKIGIIGRSLAQEMTAFYTRLNAVQITLEAFEKGVLNSWPIPKRVEQAREGLNIWLDAQRIGEGLVRKL